MRNVWAAPGSQSFQGSNQPLWVQTQNTIRSGFYAGSYDLQMNHQQEDAVDGGFANSIMFHFLLDPVLNDNKATITSTVFVFDANGGASGTAQYKLGRRPRTRHRS